MERNPAADPYTPGSGFPPPYLAGRDTETGVLQDITLARLEVERPARPVLFTGIRGVGKTALLTVARRRAAELRLPVIRLEASGRRDALLTDLVRQLDDTLRVFSSRLASTRRALEELTEFQVGVRVAGSGAEVSARRGEGVSDVGERFRRLFLAVATAAVEAGTPIVMVVDELQQGPGDLLGPVLAAFHEANQDEIPVGLVVAGLPNTDDWVTEHVTYGGRMFDQHQLGFLNDAEATRAYAETLAVVPDETFTSGALERLVDLAQGLPYFIQEYGSATWRAATDDPISLADVERGLPLAHDAIDRFYRQRFTEASPREAEYLRALARLPGGPQTSSRIASEVGASTASVATHRKRLIRDKGLLLEPSRGLAEFALPGMRNWLTAQAPNDS